MVIYGAVFYSENKQTPVLSYRGLSLEIIRFYTEMASIFFMIPITSAE